MFIDQEIVYICLFARHVYKACRIMKHRSAAIYALMSRTLGYVNAGMCDCQLSFSSYSVLCSKQQSTRLIKQDGRVCVCVPLCEVRFRALNEPSPIVCLSTPLAF